MPRVIIALATHNGARHLAAQLASYEAQTHAQWDLWASDDGSTDATRTILAQLQQKWAGRHQVRLLSGPQRGPAVNFLSLLCHPELPKNAFVAISDQDDVWLPEKLARALSVTARASGEGAVLYGAQSIHVDQALRPVGQSSTGGLSPSFRNALTQNIVSGHTTLLNPAALSLLRRAGVPKDIPFHDWWIYQLISGAGGVVHVDEAKVLKYRQHTDNVMGSHQGLGARATRLRQLFNGTYGGWFRANLAALQKAAPLLSDENLALVERLGQSTNAGGLTRLRILRQAGLHRQSRVEQVLFDLAAALGKV